MPRTARAIEAGLTYHVLNRGNGRMKLFHKDADFEAFERVLGQGLQRYPVRLLPYCLMGNHWHLVLQPETDDSLGRFMGWVGVTHVRRHHEHYHTRGGGRLYQGRFKSIPVQTDEHFLTVCRYVERNALTARIVRRAEDWRWGSLWARRSGPAELKARLSDWPVTRRRSWVKLVNRPMTARELDAVRTSVVRSRPFRQRGLAAENGSAAGPDAHHPARRPDENAAASAGGKEKLAASPFRTPKMTHLGSSVRDQVRLWTSIFATT